ncbi:MAG: type I toxin-antitoxin system ptaRNA1 family toxin [Thalassolituus sp.]
MRTRKAIECNQALHQAASAFAAMDYLDQDDAQEIGALALAIIEVCMVVNYQAGTGLASRADFRGAAALVRRKLWAEGKRAST